MKDISLEESLCATGNDGAAGEVERLRAKYEQCRAELLAIHEIACCGYANVLQHPIMPDDTLTVRDVKIMAMELLKRNHS